MLDWLGKMIGKLITLTKSYKKYLMITKNIMSPGLPPQFLSRSPGSRGGGVIQTSASECVLDCLLAARAQVTNHSAASGHVTPVLTSYWPGHPRPQGQDGGEGGGDRAALQADGLLLKGKHSACYI